VLFTVDGRAAGFLGRDMGRASLEPIVIGYLLSAINLPTYLSVEVTDAGQAEQVLPRIFQNMMVKHRSPEFAAETYTLEPYSGKNVYVFNFTVAIAKIRLYVAVIGDQLEVASRRDIVTDLIDAQSTSRSTTAGNLEFSVYRTAFREIEPTISLGYQEDIRHACHKNLALVETLLDTGRVPPDDFKSVAFSLRGYEPYCPANGRYYLDPETGRAACSLHGKLYRPIQPVKSSANAPILRAVNSLKKINARLSFTPEGLMTTVELQRKGNEQKKK
jgi:hypothetical protein